MASIASEDKLSSLWPSLY